MTAITEFVPTPSPRASASFDFVDIANGTGQRTFYLTNHNISGSASYALTQDTASYGDVAVIVGAGGSNSTYSFDLPIFNLPSTIKGTATVNVGLGANQATYVTCRLYHVDASSNATAITNETQSRSLTSAQAVVSFPLALTTTNEQQHFKKGEKLRLAVRMNVAAGASNSEFGVDPANRDGTVLTTEITSSRIYIPFKIDI